MDNSSFINPKEAYKHWSALYDTNENKTRDLEAVALREILAEIKFDFCLELGCGTGKNTEWLISKAKQVTAVDLSEEMLAIARQKIKSDRVQFHRVDITQPWTFTRAQYDLVSFSLVLEHIENLDSIFKEASEKTSPGGFVYVGELHPFKQYTGTKARFKSEKGLQVVTCFNHHLSEFIQSAKQNGLRIIEVNEYFDKDDNTAVPRILALLFKKSIQ